MVKLPFFLKETWQTEYSLDDCVLLAVVQTYLNVVDNGHILEKPYILKGTGYSLAVYLYGGLPREVLAVESKASRCRLIDPGQHIEHRGLSRAVGTDKSVKLSLFHLKGKIVNGVKSAEGYA